MGIKISEARARLLELARRLARSPGSVEYIEHRDLDEDLALTTRSHIEYLQRTLAELRKRTATPFTLAGSVTSSLSADELAAGLDEARREQSGLAGDRARELAG